jgi:serine/threonine protein kinase
MLHEGFCKIVDLGFGKQLRGDEVARTKLGSNLTMAPEVMQGLPYDFKADIWSIGVVFYQMLYGKFPIHARTPLALLEKAKNHDYSLESEEVSEDSKDFISKCLQFDPDERINWIDIYRHPLIAD